VAVAVAAVAAVVLEVAARRRANDRSRIQRWHWKHDFNGRFNLHMINDVGMYFSSIGVLRIEAWF